MTKRVAEAGVLILVPNGCFGGFELRFGDEREVSRGRLSRTVFG